MWIIVNFFYIVFNSGTHNLNEIGQVLSWSALKTFFGCIMSAITNHWNKMKMLQRKQLRVVMILFCCVQFHVQSCDEIEDVISRSQFPEGFLFGTGTSSYQAVLLFYFSFLCFQIGSSNFIFNLKTI